MPYRTNGATAVASKEWPSDSSLESEGESLVSNARASYLASGRSEAEWAALVDAIARTQQRRADDASVELPRNGIHKPASSSSSSRFESLLDELYLSQGFRNSHHARVAAAATAGSSLVNASLSNTRFMTTTCYRSMKDLFLQQDPTLEAIFEQYRDLGGATNPEAYADFLHSIITLSQRWKRYLFFREDPVDYLRQARALFGILDDYLAQKLLTFGEMDFIESVLYDASIATEEGEEADETTQNKRGDEQFLLAAWANCWEVLRSGASDPTPAVLELYDSILHILDNQIALVCRHYTSEATNFLLQLNSSSNFKFAGATLKHLMSLIQQHARFEERRRRGDATPFSPADVIAEKQSTLLFACFAESASSQDVYELIDTLQLIGASWRKSSPHLNLLECLRYVEANGLISAAECDAAELLVYERDAFMLAAWSVYEEADYSKRAFDDFIESVRAALEHEFRRTMAKLARDGYALVNAWSVSPDAQPNLHADVARDEVLGIQRTRIEPTEFVLPAQLRGTLSAQHSAVLRSLLAARDEVLLALLAEFDGSRDLAELLEGIELLIARELQGTASAAHGAIDRQQQEDIYQLSEMLQSLKNDGYLSEDTLVLLLEAVQERADPVLLAAFSLYKESLQAGGPRAQDGWPEMWDTLQRVYQRLQRDLAQQPRETAFLSPHDAVLLRDLGADLLDSLSASSTAASPVSITDTLYLRDLLRQGDPTLYAIISLVASGEVADAAEVSESLLTLGRRWAKELDCTGARTARVLTSLAQAQYFTPSALDYLLGLVYARDPTLAAAFSLYSSALEQEGSDDEEDGEDEEEFEEDEEDDDDDQSYSEFDSDSVDTEERKYDESSSRRSDVSSRTSRTLEFVDTLQHIINSGQRTISQILGANADGRR